ncbi:MAG TPA: hypothetical protein VNO30_28260 [Kofleriaceae bacterium]|nr:hypothetical protein [Kofleriaceae bacterium]
MKRDFGSRGARLGLALALCLLAWLHARTASAQAEKPRLAINPPLLELKRKGPPGALDKAASLRPSPAAAAPSHEASLDLNIVYTDGQIWNPAVGRYDRVRLRSYQGTRVDPDNPFISPWA